MIKQAVVTGAAGYIGSHVCKELISEGFSVIAIDDLSTGDSTFLHPEAIFYEGKVQNKKFLESVFAKIVSPELAGVVHCAGLKFAGESVKYPLDYYENNTIAVQVLLSTMHQYDLRNLVFSSSCSVYGSMNKLEKINENDSLKPISPYGRSKLFAEQIILDAIAPHGLRATALRYFNVAGNGDGDWVGYDKSPFNLFPNLYRAMTGDTKFEIYGDNFDTPDGSCIRDYVDVSLLAKAHTLALKKLINKERLNFAYNLGSGAGTSVFQIIEAARKILNGDLNITISPPRNGDPDKILADTHLAQLDLEWNHNVAIDQMLESGWKAWNKS
jgi:UDP-glucose 4-epimerase